MSYSFSAKALTVIKEGGSFMPGSRVDRRGFLMGSIASVPLIGTVMAGRPHEANNVPALGGSCNSVVIPTHEFAGNLDERLDFPADWFRPDRFQRTSDGGR
jgi:hypothetical protein